MSMQISLHGRLNPPYFDRNLIGFVNKYAKHHFGKLGKDWDDVLAQVENAWIEELGARRVKIEGRRGTARPLMPIENMKDKYAWEVIQEGTRWIFRFGAIDVETGKEMRRLEYQRKIQYEAIKTDVPPRPGRPRREDLEVIEVTRGIGRSGLGPIRYTKHILLETWEWSGGTGGAYQFTNMAPFRGRCIQIFNDAIHDMERFVRGRTR